MVDGQAISCVVDDLMDDSLHQRSLYRCTGVTDGVPITGVLIDHILSTVMFFLNGDPMNDVGNREISDAFLYMPNSA